MLCGKTLTMCSVILEPRVIREIRVSDTMTALQQWHEKNVCAVGVLFTSPVDCQEIRLPASEMTSLEQLKKKITVQSRMMISTNPSSKLTTTAWLPS